MRKTVTLMILAAAPLLAQQDLSRVEITSRQLSPRIHMLTGAGGNIGVLTSEDGVVLIDDQFAPLTPKILEAVRKISDAPVRYVFNTHWHGDHTGGNENMGDAGAVIVAHANVRERMSSEQFNSLWNHTTPPSAAGALPVITFSENLTLHVDGERVRVIHLASGHTDGDSVVYFPESNVIHTGDLYFNGTFPYIDVSSGGSIDGIIAAGDRILALADAETLIIPGHGALSNVSEYRKYLEMVKDIRQRLTALHAKGMTLEEAIAAKPLEDLAAAWGGGFIKADTMIRIVYPTLEAGHSR